MVRPLIAFVVLCAATPAVAAEKSEIAAPSAAVAAAWAKEAQQKGPSTGVLNALYGSVRSAPDTRHGLDHQGTSAGGTRSEPVDAGGLRPGVRDQGAARRRIDGGGQNAREEKPQGGVRDDGRVECRDRRDRGEQLSERPPAWPLDRSQDVVANERASLRDQVVPDDVVHQLCRRSQSGLVEDAGAIGADGFHAE